MSDIDVNVLLIGKSGAGKSSLINYLCGKDVEKTGTGKPVTEKGIFEHSIEMTNNSRLCIADTWGLEPDKTQEWKQLIQDEIKKRDVENIREWFHFIIYCINAQSARVEDFEGDFVRDLVNENNHVIVALTHCDNIEEPKISGIKNVLRNVGIKAEDIVCVCSVEKKLIGGKKIHNFGKEELIDKIQKSFWKTICHKIPKNILLKVEEELGKTTAELKKYVDGAITIFNAHSNSNFKTMNRHCNKKYKETLEGLEIFAKDKLNEAVNYYMDVCKIFYMTTSEDHFQTDVGKMPMINFRMDFEEKVIENLATMVVALIPLAALFLPGIVKEDKQDKYKEAIDSVHNELVGKWEERCQQLEKYLQQLKV